MASSPPPVKHPALITGPTHGIGIATAHGLAAAGHDLLLLCRNEPLGRALATTLQAAHPGVQCHVIRCDLADLDSVRAAARVVREQYAPLSVLLLNAGMAALRPQRAPSGIDLNFAVNHLGHFLLTELLRDHLAPRARVVGVASLAHYRGRLDLDAVADPLESIRPMASYARSKLANVMHCLALARRLEGSGVTAHCVHPGIVATHLLPRWLHPLQWLWRRQLFDAERGARSSLHAALDPALAGHSGLYLDEHCRQQPPAAQALDTGLQEALWDRSRAWTGA